VTEGVDILFVRELLGGLYFGEPRAWNRETGAAWNTMRYTRDEVARVAHVAFHLAGQRVRKLPRSIKPMCWKCHSCGAPR